MGDEGEFSEIKLAAIRIRLIEAQLELEDIIVEQSFRDAFENPKTGMHNNNPLLPVSAGEEPFFVIYDIDWSKYGRFSK
jgi:hypothetical protein